MQSERKYNFIWVLTLFCLGFCSILYFALPAKAASHSEITQCQLEGATVNVQGTIADKYQSEDVHLLLCNVSQDIKQAEDLGSVNKNGNSFSFSYPLINSNGALRLDYGCCLAVPADRSYTLISSWHYVTNPEILSQNAPVRNDHGIKGILPATTNAEIFNDLGIKQIMFNLELGAVIAKSKGKDNIVYHYAGRDYYFSSKALADYDRVFRWCQDNNYQLTVTLLNASSSKNTDLIHPDAKDKTDHPTYAINTATQKGIDQFGAIISFLTYRYSGGEYGTVDNWILGNQVNARTEWYFHKSSNLDVNAQEYAKAFRIMYNEVKAINRNANVYMSLDQEWNRKSNPGCFTSREFMSRFAYYIKQGGDIDWSLGIHPYDAPIYDPYAWLQQKEYVYDNARTPYLTISNIDVLIKEMRSSQYLNSAGQVRNIMLSQIGYSSSFGEELQAASIAYAYSKALQYPEIKGFILYREMDDPSEIAINMAQGLRAMDGHPKLGYVYYKTAGTPEFAQYSVQFQQITGHTLDELLQPGVFNTRDEWLLSPETDPARGSVGSINTINNTTNTTNNKTNATSNNTSTSNASTDSSNSAATVNMPISPGATITAGVPNNVNAIDITGAIDNVTVETSIILGTGSGITSENTSTGIQNTDTDENSDAASEASATDAESFLERFNGIQLTDEEMQNILNQISHEANPQE